MTIVEPSILLSAASQIGLSGRFVNFFQTTSEAAFGISLSTWIASPAASILFCFLTLLLFCLLVYLQISRLRERSVNASRWSQALSEAKKRTRDLEHENAGFKQELDNFTRFFTGTGGAFVRSDAEGVIRYTNCLLYTSDAADE